MAIMEEEAEVEALLKQIALAKQKELRLRAEKKRIRDEMEQLQAGTLWTREEQTQKQLLEVRRAKEQLEAQKKVEEGKLMKLSSMLKEQELKFRKSKQTELSPFQQVAVSVVAVAPTTFQQDESSIQNKYSGISKKSEVVSTSTNVLTPELSAPAPPVQPTDDARAQSNNQEMRSEQYDTLQRLIRNIDCEEQQKRVEKLQAELEKANARRRDAGFTPSKRTDDLSTSPACDYLEDSMSSPATVSPDSKSRQATVVRKAANKFMHVKPLESYHASRPSETDALSKSTNQPPETPQPSPLAQPASIPIVPSPAYPPQFVLPGYCQSHPVQIAPYPLFSPSTYPVNPYGFGFPSPYFGSCSYPTVLPWLSAGTPYPYQIGTTSPPEQLPKVEHHHQEEEIHRLERELEMQRAINDQQAEAKEFARLQGRLQELQTKITVLANSEQPSKTTVGQDVTDDTDDLTLKSLKKQHLESLAKVRNERDLLEEQEKLDELKDRIQRRREEKMRELDHEDWVAKQKRELVELRLQRAIQHDDIKAEGQRTDFQEDFMGSYNPDSGFTLFWDYAANVPAAVNDLQITYAIFEGKIIRTPFKVVASKETKAVGPQHKLCLFLSSRHVKKLSATLDLRIIMEVASVSQSSGGGPRVPTSLGWTAFDIFKVATEGEFVLAGGFVKLPVKQSLMPDPSKVLVLPPTPGECGDIKVHIRLVHGERVEEASRVLVNPESHGARYQLPDIGKVSVQPQSRGMMARRPSIQGRKTPNDKLTKPLDDQKAASSFVRTERLLDPPRSAHSQKQDFLDVDRLRLLSAASSRPPTTRPRSNIPATSDRVRLPAFPEDNDEADEPWIRVDNTAELQRRLLAGNSFQPGDGFNVFVDGGRGFPDNATISKVTIAALHADRTQVLAENGSAFPPATSSAFDPVFEAYVEYRQGTFNPTLTLVIRVDTVELVSKQPVILGYSVFPVFLDAETREQPNRPSIPQFILNEGGFQLPLHTQVQSTESLSAKSCDGFPRIPCATVLLRIVRAKLSGDGLTLLSRKNFQPQEWEANGLLAQAPQYADKLYDSLRCIPSGIEEKLYSIRHKSRKPKTVTQCLQQISLSISEARDMLKTKPSNYLDLTTALRYEPAIGFRVAVDALHSVKAKGGTFFKVLFSVYPPGSFYQAIRLTGDVYFTTTMDWASAQSSPEFGDGYMTLRDSPSDNLLVVLFDVRSMTRHPKTGAMTSQPYGWTFLPVLAHARSVSAGTIQLPLFQGEVNLSVLKTAIGGLNTLVDDIGNEKVKQLVLIEEGASLFVRLQDPQLPHLSSQPITNATLSKMIPSRLSAKYAYDTAKVAASKKKVPFYKLLPANVTDKQFEKELNQAFAQVRLDRCIYSPAHFSLMRLWADRKWGSTTCSSSQASGDSSSSSVKMPMPPSTNRADLSTRKKPSKSRTRFSLPHLRLRAKKTPLQLEDFDDVSYKMEIVRLGDAADSTEDHVALLESLFLALVCLLLLGGCVAVGFATHLVDYSREVLSWLLPMLLLPLAWVAALFVWERRAIAMQSKIATQ